MSSSARPPPPPTPVSFLLVNYRSWHLGVCSVSGKHAVPSSTSRAQSVRHTCDSFSRLASIFPCSSRTNLSFLLKLCIYLFSRLVFFSLPCCWFGKPLGFFSSPFVVSPVTPACFAPTSFDSLATTTRSIFFFILFCSGLSGSLPSFPRGAMCGCLSRRAVCSSFSGLTSLKT